jgi:hypothetical protein
MEDTNPAGTPAPVESVPVAEIPVETLEVTEAEAGEEGQEPAESVEAEVKAEIKRIKKLQLKIDGEEFEEDLPFEIDEDQAEWMKKHLQMSKVSQKRMQEKSTLEGQVKQLMTALHGDTKNTLAQLGIDPLQLAGAIVEEQMKLQQMTPEQREKMELQAKLKAMEEERTKEKEAFERKELERLQQLEYEAIDTKMTAAIEKSGLPKNPAVVKKMADYMLLGLQAGVNLEPADVVDLVRDEIHSDLQSLIRALGEDKVEDFIGKDVLSKIRKKNVGKTKITAGTAKAAIKDVGTKPAEEKAAEKKSMKDYFKQF